MCSSEKKSDRSEVDTVSTIIDTSRTVILDSIKTDSMTTNLIENYSSSSDSSLNRNERHKKETNYILKFIESPDGENLSGIGYIYNYTFYGISIFSLPASLILFIIALLIKLGKTKTILITIGLLSLICFGLLNFDGLVYGYWITLIFYISSTSINWLIIKKENCW